MKLTRRNLLAMGLITCLMVSVLCLPGNAILTNDTKKVNINTAEVEELQVLPRIGRFPISALP